MKHMPPPHVALLAAITAFLAKSGMSKSSFGTDAVGDPAFVTDLEKGREPRSRVIARAYEFMAEGVTHEAAKEHRTGQPFVADHRHFGAGGAGGAGDLQTLVFWRRRTAAAQARLGSQALRCLTVWV